MKTNYQQMNGIALAYLGDAVYEVYVRQHLLMMGYTKPNYLQHRATHFVSAKAQAALIKLMDANNILTDEEKSYFKRGRNAQSHTKAKHTDAITYRISTGFEAIFGYLALSQQSERINELAQWCINKVEAGETDE